MILILSNNDDLSTDEIIDWLIFKGEEYFRINGGDYVTLDKLTIDSDGAQTIIKCRNTQINLKDLKSFWYRRGEIRIAHSPDLAKQLNSINLKKLDENSELSGCGFSEFFRGELDSIEAYLALSLNNENHKSVGNFYNNYTIKIQNLQIAVSFGLSVPNTIITSSKVEVVKFKTEQKRIVIKAIKDGVGIDVNDIKYQGLTMSFCDDDIKDLPNEFFPMLFQKELDKKYELRIFYLKGNFYSSAIFSQNDIQTQVDFRNYNHKKPNRTPPFKLPKEIEEKLILLMNKIKMDSGSIDMVVTKANEFVFLEVNPIGQFSQVSKPCNYFLERLFAKTISIK